MGTRVSWFKRLTLAVDDIYKDVNDNDGACPADACTAWAERAIFKQRMHPIELKVISKCKGEKEGGVTLNTPLCSAMFKKAAIFTWKNLIVSHWCDQYLPRRCSLTFMSQMCSVARLRDRTPTSVTDRSFMDKTKFMLQLLKKKVLNMYWKRMDRDGVKCSFDRLWQRPPVATLRNQWKMLLLLLHSNITAHRFWLFCTCSERQ